MNKIAYQRPDGGTSIVIPTAKADIERDLKRTLTDQEYETHVRDKSLPADASNIVDIQEADIPQTREFRNAWVLSGAAISEDLTKSIDIKLAQVRTERDARLTATDADYMKALESGDTATLDKLKVTRQALRDATESLKVGTIASVDELRGKTVDDYLPKG